MIDSGNNRITGIILDICDGIISVSGLNDASVGELISFKDRSCEISGFILNSESDICRIPIIRGNESDIKVGDIVYRTNKLINARCGFGVLGEIIDPLGNTILTSKTDTVDLCLSNLFNTTWSAIEVAAPGIINRSPIRTPLMTGVSSIDSFIPIGCGQRELIIGDHNTGKTSLAITAIINQSEINNNICGFWEEAYWGNARHSLFIPCIYVSIGAKRSEIVRIRKTLLGKNALHYTCIVFTSADEFASVQYLAPFSGCAIGEWFMNRGYNAVVVYDDLTQHAVAYRQMSLLLRRPPGREAYPGDIFFSHSRLLERSAQLLNGGSLTALPIVTTLGGDLSGYISTNVISITDGQIFLSKSLINKGIRPAVDSTSSVSRIGSAAQYPAMAFVPRLVKGINSLYKIYSGISKLGGADNDVMLHVYRGERLLSSFTQSLYETYSFYKQVVCLYASTLDSMDNVLPKNLKLFFNLMYSKHFNYLQSLDKRIVTFFMKPALLDSLLIIFDFDIIKDDLTYFINNYAAFFKAEIQDSAEAYLLSDIVR